MDWTKKFGRKQVGRKLGARRLMVGEVQGETKTQASTAAANIMGI